MNLIKLSWKNAWFRPLNSGFTIFILALGLGLLGSIIRISNQVQTKFENNMAGVDMVVGAKGSPLQLILSALFHIDVPTGNIPLEEANKLKNNRFIKWTIPLSYGDSFSGFRIVGTDTSYLKLYNAVLDEGNLFNQSMEVVVGSQVALKSGLKVGDEFESAHGLEAEGMTHDEDHFRVVGILSTTGSIIDQLIITPSESVWHVHGDHDADAPKEITALLVKFSSPMGIIQIPRMINQNTSMQAALPAYEINKLFSMLGIGIDLIIYISYILIIVAAASLWVSLSQSLNERSYELALLRTYGASKSQLFGTVQLEAFWLVLFGSIFGYIFCSLSIFIINFSFTDSYGQSLKILTYSIFDLYVMIGTIFIGFISALLPALRAANMDISTVLAER